MAGKFWKNDGKWNPKYLLAWIAWILITIITFFILELNALFDNDESTPTLTETITRWVPGWLLFSTGGALVVWCIWHFIASYHQHKLLGDELDNVDEDVVE